MHVNFHISDQHMYRNFSQRGGVFGPSRSIATPVTDFSSSGGETMAIGTAHPRREGHVARREPWRLRNARIRDIAGRLENLRYVTRHDTAIDMRSDFGQRAVMTSTLTTPPDEHIERETKRGAKVAMLKLERFGRTANPFSIYVLMVIGGIAARKLRGGMIPPVLGRGHRISFRLRFQNHHRLCRFGGTSAECADFNRQSVRLAAWLPNLIFAAVGALICWKAPK